MEQISIIKFLQKNRKSLLESWLNKLLSESAFRDDLMTNEEVRMDSEELLNSFINNLSEENIKDPQAKEFEPIFDILAGISISRAKKGFSPTETAFFVLSLKNTFLDFIAEQMNTNPAALQTSIDINKLMDAFTTQTFQTFIKGREEVILRQTDEISEISTPVIRVWDSILALPIIGTLDSARTQVVMENLLQAIVDTESTIAILDISGVPAVDSLVAQHLIKTVSATRLMGAECIISGIRPEIAQTVVHLGIDLSNIITKSTLANALKTAFAMLQLDVKKRVKENVLLK